MSIKMPEDGEERAHFQRDQEHTWIIDVEFIARGPQPRYQASIFDARTRRLVAHSVSSKIDGSLVEQALEAAIATLPTSHGKLRLVHDASAVYDSAGFQRMAPINGILPKLDIDYFRRGFEAPLGRID